MQIWHSVRGFLAGAFALVACPCHLPLTLPIILTLTAGTAIGGWLTNNSTTIYIISAILFAGSLFLSVRWFLAGATNKCLTGAAQKGS